MFVYLVGMPRAARHDSSSLTLGKAKNKNIAEVGCPTQSVADQMTSQFYSVLE